MCCQHNTTDFWGVLDLFVANKTDVVTMYKVYLIGCRGLMCIHQPTIVQCDYHYRTYAENPLHRVPPIGDFVKDGGLHVFRLKEDALAYARMYVSNSAIKATDIVVCDVIGAQRDLIAADRDTCVFRALKLAKKDCFKYQVERCEGRVYRKPVLTS